MTIPISMPRFSTKGLLDKYVSSGIFPKIGNISTLAFFKSSASTTHQKIENELKIFFGSFPLDAKDYMKVSANYGIQSLIKGCVFYIFSESTTSFLEENYSNKFLNLYYAHTFLSYSILQLNGINFEIKRNVLGDNEIFIKYVDSIGGGLCETPSSIIKKSKINHEQFWEIFYKIIQDKKGDFFIDLIPGIGSYFQENNFLKKQNESQCRNFYTYNYSSVFLWSKRGAPNLKEEIKTHNTYASDTRIQVADYNRIKSTVEKELIYLFGLLEFLSNKKDVEKELLTLFKGRKLKSQKDKIIDGIDDFLGNLKAI